MKIKDFIDYEQPTDYIVESDRYSDKYETPVLTAGQSFVLGYTNEKEGIYNKNSCIIFDDFTTSVHYVDFPFKVKSSAMKILTSKRDADLKYCYYLLLSLSKMPPNHKRQWISTTSEKDHSLPSTENQVTIVKQLDLISKTITWYKKQIENLDVLVRSRFVEMFGNPVANEKGWEISLCKNLMSKIGSGATPKGGKESYCDEGISLIRSMNVYNNRFEYKDLAHITDDQAGQLENVTIEKKDVLLNITGASVARCCVVPDDLLPARVNQHVSIIRCKERILPEFLCCMFTEDNYQRLLWNIATAGGATREAITKQQIEELMLIVPPIDLQRQYITFVKWIDKLKSAVQAALDKTQLLFDSLMQEYFG
ncbi:restriction endonuclease subunit S [Allobaculum stercoricanis]|uniref:restriction endonuclease subunit S n=1 Tax=Allobaculum stercoricanis TaxID=174709 RepID=UPI00248E1897|nr:restriction endonuclease subunit S [Allobaculum stercoricanis]